MNNFEIPDIAVTPLTSIGIINNSNNELAIINRIPSVDDVAKQDD